MSEEYRYTKGELVGAITRAVPYAGQIRDWDLDSEGGAVRFTWRRSRYRVSRGGMVEEVLDGFLSGGGLSILMEELIKHELMRLGE